jgi:hypothetical protein
MLSACVNIRNRIINKYLQALNMPLADYDFSADINNVTFSNYSAAVNTLLAAVTHRNTLNFY